MQGGSMKVLKSFLLVGVVLLIFTILGYDTQAQLLEDNYRYVLVPKEYLNKEAIQVDKDNELPPIIGFNSQGLTLRKLSYQEINSLARYVHDQYHVCGGFIDVTDEVNQMGLQEAQSKLLDLSSEVLVRREFDKSELSYPEQVKLALSKADRNKYWAFVHTLTQFNDRSAYTESGKMAALFLRDYALKLASHFGKQDRVEAYAFETGGKYIQPSVVIRIKGADSTLPATVIGGHFDTYENNKPGADDNATGSATVMETYRAILESGLSFNRDTYFMFYAAEEKGLVGSAKIAKAFKNKVEVRGVVQFDMTAFDSPKEDYQMVFMQDYTDAKLTDFLVKLATKYVGIERSKIGFSRCGYGCSDHASWHREGFSAAMPSEASMRNMNKKLHTKDDKMEYLSLDHSERFLKLAVSFVVEAAEPL